MDNQTSTETYKILVKILAKLQEILEELKK